MSKPTINEMIAWLDYFTPQPNNYLVMVNTRGAENMVSSIRDQLLAQQASSLPLEYEVIGETHSIDFSNSGATIVSFCVPVESRWRLGKYKITAITAVKEQNHDQSND